MKSVSEIRWAFVSLVAAWVVSATASSPSAAEVFDGDLLLTTQAQVDEFAYTEVTGDVYVHDDGTDPITNLDGLNGLTSVGSLWILDNDSLLDLGGLSGLEAVEHTLEVFSNDALSDLRGLSSLTSVGGWLGISVNDSLINAEGLSSLTSVGGLSFFANESLTNVDGLSNVTWVGGLDIFANPSLTNVDGLSNVTYAGSFGISSNDSLTDLDGLSGLMSVGGSMTISDNDSLTDLDGLCELTSVGLFLSISRNDSLTEFCGLYPLLAADGLGGGLLISDNAANPTEQDILDAGPCDPADPIKDLFDEGALNRGQAEALLRLADHSLEGLGNILEAFVTNGLLTPSEAQLLFVIALNHSSPIP